jgi:hypothetical protein
VVVPAIQHLSSPVKYPIHCSRDARGDALHPAAEGERVLCFYKQVNVIFLDRIVDDAEALALHAHPERPFELLDEPNCSE